MLETPPDANSENKEYSDDERLAEWLKNHPESNVAPEDRREAGPE